MNPSVPISWGDLIDKITILEIKSERLSSETALANVRNELLQLAPFASSIESQNPQIAGLKTDLKRVNETLWKIENHHLAFGDDSYFARTFRFTLVSLGFALLLPWASDWKLSNEGFGGAAVRRIALWSYGLYLVHLPVFRIVTEWVFGDPDKSLLRALASFTLQIGGAILLSALLYRFFESRCTRLREKAAPVVAGLFLSGGDDSRE